MNLLSTTMLAAGLSAAVACAAAHAADAGAQVPMRDPWVPAPVRHAASAPTTRGSALKAQVEDKLRASFEAADVAHAGSITRAQAQAAHLGIVADNFDRIDTRHAGRVSFEDVKRFLRLRGAATL